MTIAMKDVQIVLLALSLPVASSVDAGMRGPHVRQGLARARDTQPVVRVARRCAPIDHEYRGQRHPFMWPMWH
jgi:hypothetical protein